MRLVGSPFGEPLLSRHVPCAQLSDPLAQPESLEHPSLFGASDTPAPTSVSCLTCWGLPDPIRYTHRIASYMYQ